MGGGLTALAEGRRRWQSETERVRSRVGEREGDEFIGSEKFGRIIRHRNERSLFALKTWDGERMKESEVMASLYRGRC